MFSCEFCEISKNMVSYRTPPVTASDSCKFCFSYWALHGTKNFSKSLITSVFSNHVWFRAFRTWWKEFVSDIRFKTENRNKRNKSFIIRDNRNKSFIIVSKLCNFRCKGWIFAWNNAGIIKSIRELEPSVWIFQNCMLFYYHAELQILAYLKQTLG